MGKLEFLHQVCVIVDVLCRDVGVHLVGHYNLGGLVLVICMYVCMVYLLYVLVYVLCIVCIARIVCIVCICLYFICCSCIYFYM